MTESMLNLIKKIGSLPDIKRMVIKKCDPSAGEVTIKSTWTVRNYSTLEKDTFVSCHIYDKKKEDFVMQSSSVLDKRIIHSEDSPCSTKSANLFQDETCCFLSITEGDGNHRTINLKEKDLHGKVYKESELSSFCWSNDSKYIAFVAEKHRSKSTSWLEKRSEKESWGEKYAYRDDWGEQMTDQSDSVIVIVNSTTLEVKVLELSEGLCAGPFVWAPDGNLVGVAFVTEPYRLGLIYCQNRESQLFHITLDGEFTELTSKGAHVQSPRFSPDGEKLVFLKSPMGGTHIQSAQLCLMNFESKEVSILIDHVDAILHENSFSQQFAGLCGRTVLPLRCWFDDNKYLVFSTPVKCFERTYVFDIESKIYSAVGVVCTAMDVAYNRILARHSSLKNPDSILLMHGPSPPDIFSSGSFVTTPSIINEWYKSMASLEPHQRLNSIPSDSPVPILYLESFSYSSGLSPLIVWVHGGPHSLIENKFNHAAAIFSLLGYHILFPNYRGSLGQGRSSLESLPGHCGSADVDDVYQSTLYCLERYKEQVDPSRVVLFGGSHGGFLVTHLSAKYPELYKAVSARNPVIDIASMTTTTDIPDWNFVESGYSYDNSKVPSGKIITDMFKMSPLSVVDQVKVPTLLLLGKEDRRVPMSQGLFYHKMLLARNVPTKAYIYDDCHPLSKVDVETDCLIQTALWFEKHIGPFNNNQK